MKDEDLLILRKKEIKKEEGRKIIFPGMYFARKCCRWVATPVDRHIILMANNSILPPFLFNSYHSLSV